jgi:hypothetical protein
MSPIHRCLLACAPPLILLAACSGEQGTAPAPDLGPIADLSGLETGWNTIEPGGDTSCSDGSTFRFFARPGNPENLVVYFQGGGGCWDGGTCDPDLQPTYTVDLEGFDPASYDGIFAFDNPENPLADHSFVFVPYCTGDAHLGNRVATYEAPATDDHTSHPFEIRHLGAVNSNAALDWTFERFFRPTSVFVSGSSAGSIPSPYYAMRLAEHFEHARISQLGDAAAGYRGIARTRAQIEWGTLDTVFDGLPEYASMPPEDFSFESMYITAAKRHPDVSFAAYDAARDAVQVQFLNVAGIEHESLLELIEANQAEIRAEVDNYRSFIAGGELHMILQRPELYSYHVDGIRFRDWLASLTAGDPLDDVHCQACDEPQTLDTPAQMPSGGGGG